MGIRGAWLLLFFFFGSKHTPFPWVSLVCAHGDVLSIFFARDCGRGAVTFLQVSVPGSTLVSKYSVVDRRHVSNSELLS